MTDSSIVAAGQGKIVTARGSVMAFKAVAAQTGGDFSLMERTVPPHGRRPLAHRHVNCSEAFWVLDGTITFVLDKTELHGNAGDFLLVPRGAATPSATTPTSPPACWSCTPRRWTPTSPTWSPSGLAPTRQPQRKSAP